MANDASHDVKTALISPFERLPDEIIEQILTATDPNGFASLILINRKWRTASQRSHLYLYHLAQCPSFATSQSTLPSADNDNLASLRQLFAREVKRNLFDAFLRPRQTIIKLVSNSISSSSCPGGEGMHFSASPRSQRLLAFNSSRIYVIDVRGEAVKIEREFKILRRPAAACIKDDATLLAVLSSEMQVDLYDLESSPPRRRQAIILDNSPRTIAISPCGSVLAAAYEGGIEVTSIGPGALPTEKRSVKCDPVDTLAFSYDGTQILGSTVHSLPPSTVILTAPYYDPGSIHPGDSISAMWTASILFPNSSRDCSHAVLLQDGSHEEAMWTFAYDRSFETFRAVRIDDLRNGTTYFTGPVPKPTSQAKMLPSTSSGATYNGELVAAGFHGKDIWIYGIPEDLDAVPEPVGSDRNSSSTGLGRQNSDRSNLSRNPSGRSREPTNERTPQWQLLCDKHRNTLISGSKITELSGLSSVKWVANFGQHSLQERLIVTAKGVMGPRLVTEEEDIDFVDGGRVAILDFDYGFTDGETTEITIEVGTDDAETLEEERRDIATEVAIVRRRTVAQRGGGRSAILRAATTANLDMSIPVPPLPGSSTDNADDDDPLRPRKIGLNPARNESAINPDDDPDVATIEEQEALESPYAHASPRSAPTLRRAATAAAVNSRLNPRLADGRPIEYRRADGRREHPHESDADNWVPPPPPYQKEDPGSTPAFMSGPSVKPLNTPPVPALPSASALMVHQNHSTPGLTRQTVPEQTISSPTSPVRATGHQRTASSSTSLSQNHAEDLAPLASTSLAQPEADNLYDATPPGSPIATNHVPTRDAAARPSSSATGMSAVSGVSASSGARIPVESPEEPASQMPHDLSSTPPAMSPRLDRPHLNLHVPDMSAIGMSPNSAPVLSQPAPRRLSNAQTWPAGLGNDQYQAGHAPGFPPALPYQNRSSTNISLPPAPSTSQVASLNHRISQGNPRRLSGGYSGPNSAYGGHSYQPRQHSQQHSYTAPRPFTSGPSNTWPSASDQPLIISTPKGVTGAFDPPERRASDRISDMQIVAPVPRRARPAHGAGSRPTVERLETIYSTNGDQPAQRSKTHAGRRLFAPWRRSPSVSPGVVHVGVHRQSSRAERSAAINMKAAKKRGWDPQKSRNKKKKRKDFEAASSAGWTDITTTSTFKEALKEKKCVVM